MSRYLIAFDDGSMDHIPAGDWPAAGAALNGIRILVVVNLGLGWLTIAIATLGLWLLVWIPLIVFGGERHKYVSVDEHGRVTSTRPARSPRRSFGRRSKGNSRQCARTCARAASSPSMIGGANISGRRPHCGRHRCSSSGRRGRN